MPNVKAVRRQNPGATAALAAVSGARQTAAHGAADPTVATVGLLAASGTQSAAAHAAALGSPDRLGSPSSAPAAAAPSPTGGSGAHPVAARRKLSAGTARQAEDSRVTTDATSGRAPTTRRSGRSFVMAATVKIAGGGRPPARGART
jgi:hypothetical protein